jgi:hypothetical protein
MRNRVKAVLILATLLAFLAPQAQAISGSPNWLTRIVHHQPKTALHPKHNSDTGRNRLEKARQHTAKARQRVTDKHAVRK